MTPAPFGIAIPTPAGIAIIRPVNVLDEMIAYVSTREGFDLADPKDAKALWEFIAGRMDHIVELPEPAETVSDTVIALLYLPIMARARADWRGAERILKAVRRRLKAHPTGPLVPIRELTVEWLELLVAKKRGVMTAFPVVRP